MIAQDDCPGRRNKNRVFGQGDGAHSVFTPRHKASNLRNRRLSAKDASSGGKLARAIPEDAQTQLRTRGRKGYCSSEKNLSMPDFGAILLPARFFADSLGEWFNLRLVFLPEQIARKHQNASIPVTLWPMISV
jgi:hypothetical protein